MNVELSEEEVEKLKDGETIELCMEIREPLFGGASPSSIDVLQIKWLTKGLPYRPKSINTLKREFDEVENIEQKVDEYNND